MTLTWTQADPLYRFVPDLAWDEPRRANLYSFSLNNPLRYAPGEAVDVAQATSDGAVARAAPSLGTFWMP